MYCSLIYSGGTVGTIFSLFVTPFTMSNGLDWSFSFYAYAANGVVWCLVWWYFGANTPVEHRSIHVKEKIYILRTTEVGRLVAARYHCAPLDLPRSHFDKILLRSAQSAALAQGAKIATALTPTPMPQVVSEQAASLSLWRVWLTLLSHSSVWVIAINNFCLNWILYVCISWLPEYFSDEWDVTVDNEAS